MVSELILSHQTHFKSHSVTEHQRWCLSWYYPIKHTSSLTQSLNTRGGVWADIIPPNTLQVSLSHWTPEVVSELILSDQTHFKSHSVTEHQWWCLSWYYPTKHTSSLTQSLNTRGGVWADIIPPNSLQVSLNHWTPEVVSELILSHQTHFKSHSVTEHQRWCLSWYYPIKHTSSLTQSLNTRGGVWADIIPPNTLQVSLSHWTPEVVSELILSHQTHFKSHSVTEHQRWCLSWYYPIKHTSSLTQSLNTRGGVWADIIPSNTLQVSLSHWTPEVVSELILSHQTHFKSHSVTEHQRWCLSWYYPIKHTSSLTQSLNTSGGVWADIIPSNTLQVSLSHWTPEVVSELILSDQTHFKSHSVTEHQWWCLSWYYPTKHTSSLTQSLNTRGGVWADIIPSNTLQVSLSHWTPVVVSELILSHQTHFKSHSVTEHQRWCLSWYYPIKHTSSLTQSLNTRGGVWADIIPPNTLQVSLSHWTPEVVSELILSHQTHFKSHSVTEHQRWCLSWYYPTKHTSSLTQSLNTRGGVWADIIPSNTLQVSLSHWTPEVVSELILSHQTHFKSHSVTEHQWWCLSWYYPIKHTSSLTQSLNTSGGVSADIIPPNRHERWCKSFENYSVNLPGPLNH